MKAKKVLQGLILFLGVTSISSGIAADKHHHNHYKKTSTDNYHHFSKSKPWHRYNKDKSLDSLVEFAEMFIAEQEQQHLKTFDDLDFNVFTNQKWDELGHSHAEDVIVHWPDGRTTIGIDTHIEDLQALFVFAPDLRIQEHPIRIAQGKWTAVTGIMEGTFSEPMETEDGTFIPPTNQPFRIMMATIARWQDGVMAEEWLFWDNQHFVEQLGLGE